MTSSSTNVEYKQEVRFAVVMYGGVSLAIYINGVAQELFHLVSATAREKAGANTAVGVDALSRTQRVYRKLSYILSNKEFREQCQKEATEKAARNEPYKVPDAPDNDTIETRFVIDIMSGASAGGINAIFLAKALANNQNIDQLKELWVNEGDIGILINDKRSVADLTLKIQKPPLSFLNSRRLYLKLLRAFDDMEKGQTDAGAESRFLDETELDLFVTTTDIQGLALPIRLSDSVVYERRHRNVFHFKYASPEAALGDEKDRNNFVSANNPFLAFAARCTSSFPFAFEPMKLADIDEVLDACPEYRGKTEARGTVENWGRFFNRNLLQATASIANRPYGDGGVLDNKPFSYAADTIARRYSSLPVERKLLYIEPSPEHAEDENLEINRVDALQNVKAALLDLPSYETIREDLQRLQERNNLITRVNDITDAIEQDLEDARVQRPSLRKGEWETLDLAGMVQRFGIYYIPYRRLRIEAATDELARTVARMLKLNEESAEYVAVRALIHAWREINYKDENVHKDDKRLELLAQQLTSVTASQPTPEQLEVVERQLRSWLQLNLSDAYRDSLAATTAEQNGSATGGKVKTANQFLLHYDFKYWLRRLSFVRSKIDQLLALEKVPFNADNKFPPTEKQQAILKRLNKFIGDGKYEQLSKEEREELTKVLKALRAELVQLYKTFRIAARSAFSSSPTSKDPDAPNFAGKLKKIQLDPKLLDYLLGTVNASGEDHPFSKLRVEECAERAEQLFNNKELAARFNAETLADDLEAAARDLRCFLQTVLGPAWRKCETLLGPRIPVVEPLPPEKVDPENCDSVQVTYVDRPPDTAQAAGVRKYLWHYLSKFDDYDQVRFPIMYGTDGNESEVVEVFRISPEDAPSLIDERAESRKPNGRLKLAGTSLHHFGAFLDRVWRQNDIMWGRLDGAERLITAMMPYPNDAPLRTALIREAHASILREELSTESRRQLSTLMSEALIRASSGEPIEAAVEKVMKDLSDSSPVKTRLASAITAIFDDDQSKQDDDRLVTFVRLGYQVNRKLDPKAVLETISRSTQTIGGIFEDLANKNGLDGNGLSWIARLGQFFWGLVQVAVPNSILNKLVHHWLYVLYLFEIVIILFGVVLARPGALQFGWTALGITAIANVLILILKDLMRMRHSVLKVSIILVCGTILILATIGLLKVAGLLGLTMNGSVNGLPPLAWLSSTAGNALSVVEPLKRYLPPIFGLVLIALVLLVLYLAEKYDFGGARETKPFEPIKLLGFKKRDMKEIHIRQGSGTSTYNVVARLSAQPPPDWIKAFNQLWSQNHPDTRVGVYRDQLRFESDAQGIQKVWSDLKTSIGSLNTTRLNEVAAERQQLEQKRKEENARKKKESKAKWDTFKKLPS
jgi:patatin-related protein